MSESAAAFTNDPQIDTASPKASPLSLIQRIVAWSAALLLLTAAVLKAWPMMTGQAIDTQLVSLGKLILIQGEILLALWLMSGVKASFSFRAAMSFFLFGVCVHAWHIAIGKDDCGCFGEVRIPTVLLLGLDVTALISLIGIEFEPRLSANLARCCRVVALCSALVIASFASGIVATTFATTNALTLRNSPDKNVWPGLAAVIDELEYYNEEPVGDKTILFVRTDCSKCIQAIADWDAIAFDLESHPGAPKIVVVEVSNSNGSSIAPVNLFRARLSKKSTWSPNIALPIAVHVNGAGAIYKVQDGVKRK